MTMNNSEALLHAAIFTVGAIAGSITTFLITSRLYRNVLKSCEDTIDSMCVDDNPNDAQEDIHKIHPEGNEALMEHAKNLNKTDYSKCFQNAKAPKIDIDIPDSFIEPEGPIEIEPDEFGKISNYIQVDLTYHLDGVLCDEDGDILDDPDYIDMLIGKAAYEELAKAESGDSIYIRNDQRECYYAVLVSETEYKDVLVGGPSEY